MGNGILEQPPDQRWKADLSRLQLTLMVLCTAESNPCGVPWLLGTEKGKRQYSVRSVKPYACISTTTVAPIPNSDLTLKVPPSRLARSCILINPSLPRSGRSISISGT